LSWIQNAKVTRQLSNCFVLEQDFWFSQINYLQAICEIVIGILKAKLINLKGLLIYKGGLSLDFRGGICASTQTKLNIILFVIFSICFINLCKFEKKEILSFVFEMKIITPWKFDFFFLKNLKLLWTNGFSKGWIYCKVKANGPWAG